MSELEKMKITMEKMELERAEMVAEIEAQIENALASMTVGIDDSASEYGSSRPSSRMSSHSGGRPRSRRPSDASKARHMRSFGTESTLAESLEDEDTGDRNNDTIHEDPEGEQNEAELPKKKRFSAEGADLQAQDGMNAVDEGISERSDKIAQKVYQIQQKVCTLLLSL